ncbi:hypothetical protein [Salinivibrio sp. KP-1]|uniref:hypothetical protein n=1 Tax=Salinivibrio sp. KP-1 TaxID=1406902 RepID=UPI0006149461|nr:hypothetical protein [Salinivibrio sp. KP-1]KKA43754.1 hypothetical protein WN56_15630 [Salinivibrio sp. KP-1]
MSMRFELTKEEIEEIVCCVVDCQLSRDAACYYAIRAAREAMAERCGLVMDCELRRGTDIEVERRRDRNLEQMIDDGRNLIAEMMEAGFKLLSEEILISSQGVGVELYREAEHIEANLMNKVFDEKGDFSLVERAAARKSC